MSGADQKPQVLRLKVLGGLSVTRDGRPLSGALAQPRRLAVLALLARGGQSGVPRERIVATLWPDVEDERARHTFNQTLYAIRREAGDDEVIVGMRELRLNTDLVSIDVVDFQSAVANRDLQRAVELYDGPFLDGFHLPGTDEFARWAERERGTLERTYTTAVEQLARDATAREDHLAAVQWWRTRAARDPLDARVAIALMQALDAAGDRSGAIQHARVYELLIDEELSLPPDREVVRFAAALRRDQRASAGTVVPAAVEELPAPAAIATAVPADAEAEGAVPIDAPNAVPEDSSASRGPATFPAAEFKLTPVRTMETQELPLARRPSRPLHRHPGFLAAALATIAALGTFLLMRCAGS
jgi:DNA-binding SARP family transcriptional activator